MVSISTISGIFDEKVRLFSELFVPNGGVQNKILRAVFGKKMASVSKKFFLKL